MLVRASLMERSNSAPRGESIPDRMGRTNGYLTDLVEKISSVFKVMSLTIKSSLTIIPERTLAISEWSCRVSANEVQQYVSSLFTRRLTVQTSHIMVK